MVLSLSFSLKKSIMIKRNNGVNKASAADDTDDSSTSSAESACVTSQRLSLRPCHTTTTTEQRRGVSFDERYNVEYSNATMIKEEVKELWYDAADYKFFRSVALDASQHIAATEKRNRAPYSYQRVIERTYAVCCETSSSSCCCAMDVDDAKISISSSEAFSSRSATTSASANVLPAADFVHLQRWLEVATSRVGLEKWSIRSLAAEKSTRRQAVSKVVLYHSPDLFSHYDNTDMDIADCIRAECERLSRPSCLFSQALAQGLAAAVAKECYAL